MTARPRPGANPPARQRPGRLGHAQHTCRHRRCDLRLERFQGRFNVFVYETEEVRGHSLNLVRDWFRLADAQILIAVFIGAIGIVNTLLISVLTQSRQIGLLRAVGATLGQINLSLAAEAGFLGAYSGLLGRAIGIYVVMFPMSTMVLHESGYAIPFVFPAGAVALAGGIVIALVSSLIPARFTRRIDVIDAIGYE